MCAPAGKVCVRVHVCISSPPQPPFRPLLRDQTSVASFAARSVGGRCGVHPLAATYSHPRHLFFIFFFQRHRVATPPPPRQVSESNVMRPSPSWFKHELRDGDRKGISLVSWRHRNKGTEAAAAKQFATFNRREEKGKKKKNTGIKKSLTK